MFFFSFFLFFYLAFQSFGEAAGWEIVAESAVFDAAIEHMAVNVRLGQRGENMIALSSNNEIRY